MKRFTKSPMGMAILAVLLVIGGWATITVVNAVLPSSVFELEGDIDDDVATIDDWINNNCADPDASHASSKTGAVADPFGVTIFTGGGSKDFLDIPAWLYKSGSVPPKDEITNAYAAKYGSVLVLGGDRESISGSAQIGAWFFQNAISPGPDAGGGGGSPFLGEHKNGDLLILAEFTQGGTVSDIRVFMWVASPVGGTCPDGNPCPAPTDNGTLADITASAVDAEGFSNAVDVTIPGTCPEWSYEDNHGNTGVFGPNAFFEVGLDLAQLGLGNVCFASFLLETRSSHEVNAVLKDFVGGNFESCIVGCAKSVSPEEVCEGSSAVYTITATNPGGADLNMTVEDDLYGNICMTGASGDPCTTSPDPCPFLVAGGGEKSCTLTVTPTAGTYVNNVTVSGAVIGGTEGPEPETCTATLVVNPNPTMTIDHLPACLFAQSFQLCSNPSGGTPPFSYLWSTGATTQCITSAATGSYTVTATDTKGCFDDDTRLVGYCSD